MSNRCALRRDRKTATEGAEVTCSGRLFQTRAAATVSYYTGRKVRRSYKWNEEWVMEYCEPENETYFHGMCFGEGVGALPVLHGTYGLR